MTRLFGTDGVRGVANADLTPLMAFHLGRAGACTLSKNDKKPVFIVGKDTRISGDMLEAALVAGICSAGADVIRAGIVPTPAVSYLARRFEADAGVVISASHNPMEYNGIKFFNGQGYKLPDEIEDEIEFLVKNPNKSIQRPVGQYVGKTHKIDGKNLFKEFIKSVPKTKFKDFRIALDTANGAAFEVAPETFSELGAEVSVINNNPDGCNINNGCGSTNPKALSEFVKSIRADIGFAFDGDADRLIAVDEKGEIVDGDHIMAICGIHLKNQGKLAKNTIVTTIMSNIGLEMALKNYDIKMVRTKVGDRYVLEEMLKSGYNFGGEQSGHIIFSDHNTTGDGLVTAINLLQVLADKGQPLSELKKVMKVYPQVLLNVQVKDKSRYNDNDKIKKAINEQERELNETGRVIVRPSGTEPLVRVMVEGEDENKICKIAQKIADIVKTELS